LNFESDFKTHVVDFSRRLCGALRPIPVCNATARLSSRAA
jgi:hypothetical protein